MNYQKLIIVGNATRDAQARQSRSGEKAFTTFDVGVTDGTDKPTYFPMVIFGKQGETVAKYVTKGRYVLAEAAVHLLDTLLFSQLCTLMEIDERQLAFFTKPFS